MRRLVDQLELGERTARSIAGENEGADWQRLSWLLPRMWQAWPGSYLGRAGTWMESRTPTQMM